MLNSIREKALAATGLLLAGTNQIMANVRSGSIVPVKSARHSLPLSPRFLTFSVIHRLYIRTCGHTKLGSATSASISLNMTTRCQSVRSRRSPLFLSFQDSDVATDRLATRPPIAIVRISANIWRAFVGCNLRAYFR